MPRQSSSLRKTTLSAVEQYELNQWLEQNHISPSNLRRAFTDVLPLARLLSRYYPEMIDLNYYPPRNSVQNKLCNWESFNKRVLTRLGLHLTRDQMVRMARSVPGSVELLLYSVMRVQMAAERKAREENGTTDADEDNDEDGNEDEPAGETVTQPEASPPPAKINQPGFSRGMGRGMGMGVGVAETKDSHAVPRSLRMNRLPAASAAAVRARTQRQHPLATAGSKEPTSSRQRGEQLSQLPKQRTVLYSIYMQAVKQQQRKDARIERFNQWSAHLENMLQLKCDRIDELQQQVALATIACRGHKPLCIRQRRPRLRKRDYQLDATIGAMLEAAKRL